MYRESSIPGYGKKNCPENYFSPFFRFILPNREAGMFLFFIRMLSLFLEIFLQSRFPLEMNEKLFPN